MKLGQLVSGIASGYVTKLIQLAASILLVPFFLRADVLGLDGYGRAFTIYALVGLLPLLTEGLQYSFVRSVSRSLDRPGEGPSSGEVLGAGLKIMGAVCGAAVALTLALSPIVIPAVGLEPSRDVVVAVGLAGLLYWVENLLVLVRTPLLARGAISFVNATSAAEVILRALAYLACFTVWPASLTGYFAIQIAFAVLRGLTLALHLATRWPESLRGALRAPWGIGRASIGLSWPLTIQNGCEVLALRLPIVVANRFLGHEASGLVALVVTTIRGYVLQSLYAVLQPIAIPLASRLDLRQLSPERRGLLWQLEALYAFVSGLLSTLAVVCMPDLIRVWLGASYDAIVLPAQWMVVACGIELAFTGRVSLLIGQGLLRAAVPGLLIAALVSVSVSTFFSTGPGIWQLAAFGCGLYFPIAAALGIDAAFRKVLMGGLGEAEPSSRVLLFLAVGGAIAWLLAPAAAGDGVGELAGRTALSTALLLGLAHTLLLPIPRVITTLRSLSHSLHRDILADPREARRSPE